MNNLLISITVTALAFSTSILAGPDDVLVARGKAVVTQKEFDVRMAKIPEQDRAGFLQSTDRLKKTLASMLLQNQLVIEAQEAGFDQDELIQGRMEAAANAELARVWLEHYISSRPEPDIDAMARDYYRLHPQEYMEPMSIDVSHILISNKVHENDVEARALAEKVLAEVQANPENWSELITTYSEDESAPANKGHFTNVTEGEMVRPFERVAFALDEDEFSGLVETRYGYHIIRVDKVTKARVMDYDQVQVMLRKAELQKHNDRLRTDYLGNLANIEVDLTDEALMEMASRYFDLETLNANKDANQSQE